MENRRSCFKCGSSPSVDGVKLFRVLKPGLRNLARCEKWAQYLFPDRNVSNIEFQLKLYNEHRMICSKHFKHNDFTDGTRKYLLRTAVPCDDHTEQELPISIPEQRAPASEIVPILGDITNLPTHHPQPSSSGSVMTGKTEQELPISITEQRAPASEIVPILRDITNLPTHHPQPSSSGTVKLGKEKILQAKCQKYLQKICQLHKQIKSMQTKTILNTLADDKNVKKLSTRITPTFALLLQGQVRNFQRKIKGRRWSKQEKITALRIFKRSPTCYRLLRRLFTLPSPSTLKTLLNKINFGVGINEPVMKVLKKFAKTLTPVDNQFVLMFDEMSLKKHLHYDSKNDLIEGFQDHGKQGRSELIAGYALVFMVGGIRKRVKQPIAYYFSSSFSTADRLAVLIKEVIAQCSLSGINIAATVCDMDGVNRRALTILGATSEQPYFTLEGKEIVSMYDTPHLLKCFRNLFIKYDVECNTDIQSTGKSGRGVAKWSHIQHFHEIDSQNPNFVFAPSLKKDHLNPNSKMKMKVNLAAQVLSHTVAAGMFAKISAGSLPAEAAVTASVCANMDKLFDAVNSDCSDLRRGKPNATNMSRTSPHKDLLEKMKSFFSSIKFIGASRKPPSIEGWIWTINAILRLWHNLVHKYNIRSLATRRLQQDPLENLFGCIRGNCGSNQNPTSGQFVAALKTAILSGLSHLGTSGNCETDHNNIINNFETLLSVPTPPQGPPCGGFGTDNSASNSESEPVLSPPSSAILAQVDEAIIESSAEEQACAYVCGFITKQLPIKNCLNCKDIFISKGINETHTFVQFKEYNDSKNSLTYVTRNMVECVELCAATVNEFCKKNGHVNFFKRKVCTLLKSNINFDFLCACVEHKENNINIIIESVFFICVKRFCVLKNRSFGEEASLSALKRKMDIILHK